MNLPKLTVVEKVLFTCRKCSEQKTREAETLRHGLETAETSLEGAQKLLGQLGGEQGRWQTQADFLRNQIATLPYYMLLFQWLCGLPK